MKMIRQDYHLLGSKPWRIKSSNEHVGAENKVYQGHKVLMIGIEIPTSDPPKDGFAVANV